MESTYCAEVVAAKARTYRATAVNRQIHSLTYLDAPVREEFEQRQSESEREHALAPNEIVTSVSVPIKGLKNGYYEIRQRKCNLIWTK